MSIGFPDGQKITQWLGAPIVQATGRLIGAGTVDDGPFNLASWASVIVAVKPTGGNVTVTIRQKISGGPASLELDSAVVVANGATAFESVVLFGDTVTLELTGTAPGETVDYALYPSNTTTNAQVSGGTLASIPRVTSLPASPVDGQLCSYYPNAATYPGVEWLCIYNASTGYWDVLGGTPLTDMVTVFEAPGAISAWVDLATDGPKVTCPNLGDYVCEAACSMHNGATGVCRLTSGIARGASAPDSPWMDTGINNPVNLTVGFALAPHIRSEAAGQVLKLRYDSNNNTDNGYGGRMLSIMPRRIK